MSPTGATPPSALADATLPRLAWCARLPDGRPAGMRVVHGPWVDAGPDWLAEGLWAGDLAAGRFDQTPAFAGSGLRWAGGRVRLVPPCHGLEPLYLLRAEDALYAGNSPTAVLTAADDGLDPGHLDYESEVWTMATHLTRRVGLSPARAGIRTRRGRLLRYVYQVMVEIDEAGGETLVPRPPSPPITTFAEWRATVSTLLGALAANAGDPRRRQRFQPLATASRGYDSLAAAVLARELGGTRALTFRGPLRRPPDDAVAQLRHLGFREIHAYGADAPRAYDLAEEFLATGVPGSNSYLGAAAEHLPGSYLLSGHGGDRLWGPHGLYHDFHKYATGVPELAWCEFRLARGFHHVPVPCLAMDRAEDFTRLSQSAEMTPWRLGTQYDRPLARRIIEEAGLARGHFAVAKTSAASNSFRLGHLAYLRRLLPPAAGARFATWLAAHRAARPLTARRVARTLGYLVYLGILAAGPAYRLLYAAFGVNHWPLAWHCSPLAPAYLYAWASDSLRGRYTAAVARLRA